jgi:hypothetical protein
LKKVNASLLAIWPRNLSISLPEGTPAAQQGPFRRNGMLGVPTITLPEGKQQELRGILEKQGE